MDDILGDLSFAIPSSFAGACGRLLRRERSQAVLWLLADHILLIYQRPVYVTMGVKWGKGYKACFSSLSENDRKFLGLRSIEHEFDSDGVTTDRIMIAGPSRRIAILVRLLPTAERLGSGALEALERGRGIVSVLLKDREEMIADALNWCIDSSGDADDVKVEEIELAVANADYYLEPIRHRIGSVLDNIGRTELTESKSGKGLNLFAVIRQPTLLRSIEPPSGKLDAERQAVTYSYTAGLCLSDYQMQWLQARKGLNGGKIDLVGLQAPLSSGARSIADTPLSQGCVDFSLPNERLGTLQWSRQYYEAGAKGKNRQDYEDVLYRMAFDGIRGPGAETIFYIPVHLNGTPWIALFTFNEAGEDGRSVSRNLLIYRDLIPLLSESISLAIQAAFAETLGAAAVRAFEKNRGLFRFVDDANAEWSVIGLFYPYQRVTLSTVGSEGDRLDVVMGDLGYELYLSSAELRSNELPYRTLDVSLLRRNIQERLQQAVDHFQGQFKEALFVFGHHAGKLFQESGLPGLETKGDSRLTGIKQRLFAAWGMSAAIRPLKNPGRGLPKDWFPENFSLQKWNPATQEIIARVAAICKFYLAMVVDKLSPDWAVLWDVEGGAPVETSFDDLAASFGDPLRGLPPLEETEISIPGTLALTLGLAEIIRNARSRFFLYERDFKSGVRLKMISKTVMQVRIEANSERQVCTVTVSNVHLKDEGEDLHSHTIEQIQRLERTALASVGRVGGDASEPAGAIVETSQASIGEAVNDDFEWVFSRWDYHYGRMKAQAHVMGG